MDLDLTSDQELFVQTSRRFIETSYPLTAVREHLGDHGDAGADYRRKSAELGWYAMLVPEDLGGGTVSGNGVFDAALVAVARGAALQPGAFVGTNVTAAALAAVGSDDQRSSVLPALVGGDAAPAWVLDDTVVAEPHASGFRLSGRAPMVEEADRVDWLLVTATGNGAPVQLLVSPRAAGVTVRQLDGLDLTRRFGEVRFDAVDLSAEALVGDPGGAAAMVHRQLDVACVLTTAESIGAMDADLGLAVAYAKDRTAFGRPIGSFQAIKHLLADTSLMLEMAKAVVTAAARSVGAEAEDAGITASIAKAFVGDCGVDLAQNCFQVFGGIGYTWEHDQHLFLRRLTTDASLYGAPSWHRERLCRLGGM